MLLILDRSFPNGFRFAKKDSSLRRLALRLFALLFKAIAETERFRLYDSGILKCKEILSLEHSRKLVLAIDVRGSCLIFFL